MEPQNLISKLILKLGNGRYSDNNFSFKIEANLVKNGVVISKELTDLKTILNWWKIREDIINKPISINDINYHLCGYKFSAKKYPFIVRSCIDGKKYKMQEDVVKKALEIYKD